MSNYAVIGLGFGDEGKGITTDFLCSRLENPLVIRYCGGPQAGHTVFHNNTSHVFSHFGSGTLRGVPTYWSKFCPVDPVGLMKEYEILVNKHVIPIIYLDKKAPIITPFEKVANRENSIYIKHGTCGVGVGMTIEREENKYSLTLDDLLNPCIFEIKLNTIRDSYSTRIRQHADNYLDEFFKGCEYLKNKCEIVQNYYDISVKYNNKVFESSQGLLLDPSIGFFPHVTRSNIGVRNIIKISDRFLFLYLVTRAYQTRHGKGPMTNENIPHNILSDSKETNVTNTFQGKFRRSLLDLDLLLYGINKEPYISQRRTKATLVITCLDHIVNEYRYTYKNKIHCCVDQEEFTKKISHILNIYDVIPVTSRETDKIKL